MDTRTGKIISDSEIDDFVNHFTRLREDFIPVSEDEMTEKQKETKQVSKHDNKSVLGKKFKTARYNRKYFFK